jgi:hypothetical protein
MMEAYSTEQINILLLAGVYMLIVAGLIWKTSKPKK